MLPRTVLALRDIKQKEAVLAAWQAAYDDIAENYPECEALVGTLRERMLAAYAGVDENAEDPALDGDHPLGNEEDAAFIGAFFPIADLALLQCGLHHLVRTGQYQEYAEDVLVRAGYIAECYGEWHEAVRCYGGVSTSLMVERRASRCREKMNAEGARLYDEAMALLAEGKKKDASLLMARAAEMRHQGAMLRAGLDRIYGTDGYPTDKKEGLTLLRESAWDGNAEAAFAICKLYDDGIEEVDARLAMSMCERAANAGHELAAARLARGFDLRPVTEILLERAEAGDADAMWRLGLRLDKEGKADEAGEWMARAIDAGHPEALLMAADLCLNKDSSVYDPAYGAQCLRAAADAGNITAILRLGRLSLADGDAHFWEAAMALGEGKTPDSVLIARHKKEFAWYTLAAEAGDADAMYAVGLAYRYGYPVTRDCKSALARFLGAVEAGNASAMYEAAYLYENGLGTKEDTQRAIALYTESAEEGVVASMLRLHEIYGEGLHGVAPDKEKAFRYLWLSGYGRD